MHESIELPEPDVDARAHSANLSALIKERIAAAGGWLSFSEYMELALYAPGLGYYSAGARKLGPSGDFVTAPEVSALFSRCLARLIAPTLLAVTDATILELGAGSGRMAADVLRTLERDHALPQQYLILEVSADLRDRQRSTILERAPHLASKVQWLDTLPPIFDGVILANEVADALPVSRFRVHSDTAGPMRIQSIGVSVAANEFIWRDGPTSEEQRNRIEAIEASLDSRLPPGYASEVSIGLPGLIASLMDTLRNGRCIFSDYGLHRAGLYGADRASGTLRCHYRHRAHDDPFYLPGLQDITAWVDFTALAEAAHDSGARIDAYTTQADFLIAAGIEREFEMATSAAKGTAARLSLAQEMQMLLMPGQMGERFKVMQLQCGTAASAIESHPWLADKDLAHLL